MYCRAAALAALAKHVGGPGTLENIQLACAKCNNERKGGAEPAEVHVWLDFLLVAQGPEFGTLGGLATL